MKPEHWKALLRGMGKGAVKGAADGLISGMVSGAVAGAMNPTFCFVAGTTVLTTLGKKAIETIQVGDAVPCVDHITGAVAEKKVIITTVNKVNHLTELEIDGEIIQCTETHLFQVKGKGWVDACDLQPGDVVYTKDWNTAAVNSVSLLELDEPVEVFNFEVEDFHTYYIGDTLVLVHNALCQHQTSSWKTKRSNYWKEQATNGNPSAWYDRSLDNLKLMQQGKAPIGFDGKKVQLHHLEGISKNMDNFIEIGADAHRIFHKAFGYKNFINLAEFLAIG